MNAPPTTVTATPEQIRAAFTEWDRRYREEPERFQAEAVRLVRGTPQSYGDAAEPYFLRILSEVQGRGFACPRCWAHLTDLTDARVVGAARDEQGCVHCEAVATP